MKIFIDNLNPQMRVDDLREEFSKFGEIVFAHVNLDRETKRSKRSGFVEFINPIDAARAVAECDKQEMWAYEIIVAYNIRGTINRIATGWSDIHKISPRQFEELIAELLKNLGYKCELTSLIKDGGKDIIAIQKDGVLSNNIYVECKHYRLDNPVGIDAIKKLHSTVIDDRVTKGIMVTTSRFTKGAQDFIKKNKWILEGKDCDDIFMSVRTFVKSPPSQCRRSYLKAESR